MSMIVVRPLTRRDLSQIMGVNTRSFSAPWSMDAIRYDVENNPRSYWLVLEERLPPKPPQDTLSKIMSWFSPASL